MNEKMLMLALAVTAVAVSAFALVSIYANAQMYASRTFYNANGNANGGSNYDGFVNGMQQEMKEVFDIQQKYQAGQITQEQYQQEIQQHWNEMAELHQGYGVGCPMAWAGSGYGWTTGSPAYGGMMGSPAYRGMMGMMW